ncbi:hypothetical protein NQ317_013891 [Molorchus minor]|uniref:Histone RNA hairpin-binding protein RNA-binding domain-containing protein n=1 Tax=Molorchus minor TaxID=1323400 RepID=A0ABQ9K7I4_9CUCU|nr:hypothetical protein NQ317_013891 [Molorchus minor]
MEPFPTKRLSMNTTLMNARIFDDDSWDAETAGFVKKEPPDDEQCPNENETKNNINIRESIGIKQEEETDSSSEDTGDSYEKSYLNSLGFKNTIKKETANGNFESSIKLEPNNCKVPLVELKTEIKSEYETKPNQKNWAFSHFHHGKGHENDTMDDGESYLDRLDPEIKMAVLNTPNKLDVIKEEDSNPSPFNKEMFRNFTLKQNEFNSPEPQNKKEDSIGRERRARRSVFSRLLPRISPYKIPSNEGTSSDKIPVKRRLGPKLSWGEHEIPRKKRRDPESFTTDPTILARRQKQIDYGKNTLGYDNYLKMVPRNKRQRDDPKTPDKFVKYSRRGWDGLIKQWRLQLHKYDPASEADIDAVHSNDES